MKPSSVFSGDAVFIPLNSPRVAAAAPKALSGALEHGALAGRGTYTKRVEDSLAKLLNLEGIFLTSSGTTALLVALLSLNLKPGERVIVPSFGFVALPQAVLLAGGTPVFVDVSEETLSVSLESLQEINDDRVRGLVLIHYAGIPADIKAISTYCSQRGWFLIEDSAHALGARHSDGAIGSFGDLSIFSFDHQKNIQVGEAGAVGFSDAKRREKLLDILNLGVNVSERLDDPSARWDWVSVGLKGYPPDYVAAFLENQLSEFEEIQLVRRQTYELYSQALENWASENRVRLPHIPSYVEEGSWHIFWLLFDTPSEAESFRWHMHERKIQVASHYSSLSRATYGRQFPTLATPVSDWAGECLVRLPIGPHLDRLMLERVAAEVTSWSRGTL